MAEFVMPMDFKINTRGGDLCIPAGSTVFTDGDDNYAGWVSREVAASLETAPAAEDEETPSEPPATATAPESPGPAASPPAAKSDEPSTPDPVPAPDSAGSPTPEPAAGAESATPTPLAADTAAPQADSSAWGAGGGTTYSGPS